MVDEEVLNIISAYCWIVIPFCLDFAIENEKCQVSIVGFPIISKNIIKLRKDG